MTTALGSKPTSYESSSARVHPLPAENINLTRLPPESLGSERLASHVLTRLQP